MCALLYLLFLGGLGLFLFCVDLIRWPISKFQLVLFSTRQGFPYSVTKLTKEIFAKDKIRALWLKA
jgi:hypothetical protein